MMDNLFWFLALVVAILVLGGLNFLQLVFHCKEKKELFIKFMAKSLGEAQFYCEEYKAEVKEKAKRLEEERKNPTTEEEIERQKKAGQY
jgi:NAD kinase